MACGFKKLPIGEFKYLDTKQLDDRFYKVKKFDFEKGDIDLDITFAIKVGKKLKGNKEREKNNSNSSTYLSWLTAPETFLIDSDDRNNIYAIPKAHQALIKKADKKLNVIHKGIHIGEMKGNTVKPAHGLSMSAHLNPSSFPSREVDTTTALSYLRCESLGFPDSPLGFLLLTYHGIPLGFVKNVGNRCNNLYPHEWRIRFK